MLSPFQQSVEERTVPFDSWDALGLGQRLDNARLAGMGEVPHHVREYDPAVLQVVERFLGQGQPVLLLREWPYWLNPYLDAYLSGRDDRPLGALALDAGEWLTASSQSAAFCGSLRELAERYPGQLACRAISLFHDFHLPNRSAFARDLDPAKYNTSLEFRENYFAKRYGMASVGLMEQFMFDGAQAAVREINPGKVVLFAGSFHSNRVGGVPIGEEFIPSLFSRLVTALGWPALNVMLMPISGTFGQFQRTEDGHFVLVPEPCSTLFPEGPKNAIRALLRGRPGKVFLTCLASLLRVEEWQQDHGDLDREFDYLMSFADVHASE